MPVVDGGSKCNFITGLVTGDDDNYYFGRSRYLCQTFKLNSLFAIFRCLFQSWVSGEPGPWFFSLYNVDANGKPTGAPIATTQLSGKWLDQYSPGKWMRFDFSSFPQLGPGTYALVCSIPSAPDATRCKLRYASAGNKYPPGKSFYSNDSGNTWNEIPNADFLFQIWGYEPPPAPPPPPVKTNWAPLDINLSVLPMAVKLVVTTDIPVHLFMRWSLEYPRKHPLSEYIRGMLITLGTYFCFVAWHENEQIETGDTLIHTFLKPNWPVCQTRFFYFVGTKQMEESPSATPIFSYHNEGVTVNYPLYLQLDNYQWTKYFHRYQLGQSYAQCREAAQATSILSGSDRFVYQATYGAGKFYIRRYPVIFDTSALPDNAEILAAILSQYTVFPANDNLDMVLLSVPTLETPVTLANYRNIYEARAEEIGRCPVAEQTSSRQFFIKINKKGLDSINKQGYTKWAMICSHDQEGVAPVDTWEGNYLSSDPTHLTIAYALPT